MRVHGTVPCGYDPNLLSPESATASTGWLLYLTLRYPNVEKIASNECLK